MAWVVTSPPAKTVATVDARPVDVLAIRVDEQNGLTEVLVAADRSPLEWVDVARIEDAQVVEAQRQR